MGVTITRLGDGGGDAFDAFGDLDDGPGGGGAGAGRAASSLVSDVLGDFGGFGAKPSLPPPSSGGGMRRGGADGRDADDADAQLSMGGAMFARKPQQQAARSTNPFEGKSTNPFDDLDPLKRVDGRAQAWGNLD